jgi:ribosomal protein S18 acetylase RimI-like enzyme
MPIIRIAAASDARFLAELAERTFRDTFEAVNTPEDMRLHCKAHYGEAIQRREILDGGMTTLVCEQEGRLVGFAQLRWGPAPECVSGARPAELQRLYVAREWQGKGVAQDLMAESLGLARAGNADLVWLGVWEHNPRAIAFYKKFGFVEAGDHVFPVGTDPQRDIVMTRPVL